MITKPTVAIIKCDAQAGDDEITQALCRGIDLVGGIQSFLAGKRKILVKPNLGNKDVRLNKGRQISLTDKGVTQAVFELIRQYYDGEIVISDSPCLTPMDELYDLAGYSQLLRKYDVRLVDLNEPPFDDFWVPRGGLMFQRYRLSAEFKDVDLVISVAKMKSHRSAGATLCLKNMFGLTPPRVYGTPRRYLHAAIRLPRVIVDMGLIFRPSICIVDGLVSSDLQEWDGPPVVTNLLLVGNDMLATDATGMRLMGMDPELDYDQFPFYWDRNPLQLAAEAGLGSLSTKDFDVVGDPVSCPAHRFRIAREWSAEVEEIRKSMVEQVQFYLRERDKLLTTLHGCYVAIAGGKVLRISEHSLDELGTRGDLSTEIDPGAIFFKQVLPPYEEDEHLEVYSSI